MRLWTIQTLAAWKLARRRGALYCNKLRCEPGWSPAYRWMVGQMYRRLGAPPHAGARWPVWAWCEPPDLGREAHLERGQKGVCVEFDVVSEHRALRSDFRAWHAVLNGWPLLPEAVSDEAWDAAWAAARADRRATVASWEAIFDAAALRRLDPDAPATWQACVWEVPLVEVCAAVEFDAR